MNCRFGIVLCACVAVELVGLNPASANFRRGLGSENEAGSSVVPVSKLELRQWLAIAGIMPESLAAMGVAPESVGFILNQANAYLAEHLQELQAAQRAAATAADKLRTSQTSSGESSQQLREAADAARLAKELALGEFIAATLMGQSQQVLNTAQAIRSNQSQGVPIQYLVANRTEEQWAVLRNALGALRSANPDAANEDATSAQAVVEAADAEAAVAVAHSNLSMFLESVTDAWNQGLDAL